MPAARIQHVFIDVTGAWSNPDLGILLEWRQRETIRGLRWEGLVIYADTYSTGHGPDWTVRQGWLDAAHIRQVGTPKDS